MSKRKIHKCLPINSPDSDVYQNVLLEAPDSSRHYNFLQVAHECANRVHANARFKNTPGRYITHPEAVSNRMRDNLDKGIALLHDVIEELLKDQRKWMKEHPDKEKLFDNEEEGITQLKENLATYFEQRGHKLDEPILDDLDALTKRRKEKDNYEGYIERLIAYAETTGRMTVIWVKLADLAHNSQRDRNERGSRLSPADRQRLDKYHRAMARLRETFTDLKLQPIRGSWAEHDDTDHNGHARDFRKPSRGTAQQNRKRQRSKNRDSYEHHRSFPTFLLLHAKF